MKDSEEHTVVDEDEVVTLGEWYGTKVVAWAKERDAQKANKLFEELQTLANKLLASPAGCDVLLSYMQHESRGVRFDAASRCLSFAPVEASRTLEALITPRGEFSLDAEMALLEYSKSLS